MTKPQQHSISYATYGDASYNFATCGIAAMGGVVHYIRGELTEEDKTTRETDGPRAKQTLDMLLFAHAVDIFQSYLANVIYEVLEKDARPIYGKKFAAELLFDGPDLTSVRKNAIDRYIMDLGYQSIDDLSKTLESSFGLKAMRNWLTRRRLTRYVQMRNIIAHNAGVVNALYLYRSGSRRDGLGSQVNVGKPLVAAKYLRNLVSDIDAEIVKKFDIGA